MFKKTIYLFIKACIIGILINRGISQVPPSTASMTHQTDGEVYQAP